MKKSLSGISLCNNCNRYYSEPEEFIKDLEVLGKKNKIYLGILICSCKEKYIVGAEYSDMGYGEGFNMFGRNYIPELDKNLKSYNSIMLIKCNENESWGAVIDSPIYDKEVSIIYLKPE